MIKVDRIRRLIRRAATLTCRLTAQVARTTARLGRTLRRQTVRLAHDAHKLTATAWAKHCSLMRERPGYRYELLAVASALVALSRMSPSIAAAVCALIRLYSAAYGPDDYSGGTDRETRL